MKKLMWIVIAVAGLALVFSGCEMLTRDFYLSEDDFPDPTKGALVLLLGEDGLAARTIAPPDLDVARYDLAFTNASDGATFSEENWASAAAYTKNGLTPGSWSGTMVAEDTAGREIAAVGGNPATVLSFTITAGLVATQSLVFVPITGTGDLSITLSWPADLIDGTASLLAYLVPPAIANPDTAYTGYPISFTVGATSATYSATGLATGYWSLRLYLRDDGVQVWGYGPESVRIVNATSTTGTLTLVGTGGASLTLVEDLKNPVDISFSPAPPASITQGANISTTAVPAIAAAPGHQYTYRWYADGGAAVFDSDASINYGGSLGVGEHSLVVLLTESLIAVPNTVRTISSQGFSFTVVAP